MGSDPGSQRQALTAALKSTQSMLAPPNQSGSAIPSRLGLVSGAGFLNPQFSVLSSQGLHQLPGGMGIGSHVPGLGLDSLALSWLALQQSGPGLGRAGLLGGYLREEAVSVGPSGLLGGGLHGAGLRNLAFPLQSSSMPMAAPMGLSGGVVSGHGLAAITEVSQLVTAADESERHRMALRYMPTPPPQFMAPGLHLSGLSGASGITRTEQSASPSTLNAAAIQSRLLTPQATSSLITGLDSATVTGADAWPSNLGSASLDPSELQLLGSQALLNRLQTIRAEQELLTRRLLISSQLRQQGLQTELASADHVQQQHLEARAGALGLLPRLPATGAGEQEPRPGDGTGLLHPGLSHQGHFLVQASRRQLQQQQQQSRASAPLAPGGTHLMSSQEGAARENPGKRLGTETLQFIPNASSAASSLAPARRPSSPGDPSLAFSKDSTKAQGDTAGPLAMHLRAPLPSGEPSLRRDPEEQEGRQQPHKASKEIQVTRRMKEKPLEASLRMHPEPAARSRRSPFSSQDGEGSRDGEQDIGPQVLLCQPLQPSELLPRQSSKTVQPMPSKQPLGQDSRQALGVGATVLPCRGRAAASQARGRDDGQRVLEADKLDHLLEQSAQLLGNSTLANLAAGETEGGQGPPRQRLLEQMLALLKTQEELMLAQLNLMNANDSARAAQGSGQAVPGAGVAHVARSGRDGCREEEPQSRAGTRHTSGGVFPPATAPTLQRGILQAGSPLQAAVKHKVASPPLGDGTREEKQGQQKSWRTEDIDVSRSFKAEEFAEADTWATAQALGTHHRSPLLDRGGSNGPELTQASAESRGEGRGLLQDLAACAKEADVTRPSSGHQPEQSAPLDEEEDAEAEGRGRIRRGFIGPSGDVFPAPRPGSKSRHRRKEAASEGGKSRGRSSAPSPAAAAPAGGGGRGRGGEAALAAVQAYEETRLGSAGNEEVLGGFGLAGGALDERAGLQSSRLSRKLPDLNAATKVSGRLCDQLAEVLEKVVTKKGAGASDKREECPVHRGRGPESADDGTGPGPPSGSGARDVCTCAGMERGMGMDDSQSPRTLGREQSTPLRPGSKRRGGSRGSLSDGAHQEAKRRVVSAKTAIEKALSSQDAPLPSAGPREPHPGLFSRRNAADGTFTPARLPRCLESLFTAPPEAPGRTRVVCQPQRVLTEGQMTDKLEAFAKALESRDTDLGKAIERDLRQSVSQSGNSVQRVGFQFLRALKVRAATTEVEQLFQSPSHLQKTLVSSMIQYTKTVPLMRFTILAGMKHLCEAVRGKHRVSILVMGIAADCLGLYPELLQELAQRPEGPPEAVKLTTVEMAFRPSATRELREKEERMREGTRALQAQAQELGIGGLQCQHLAVDCVDSLQRLLEVQDQLRFQDSAGAGDERGEESEEASDRMRGRGVEGDGCVPREGTGKSSGAQGGQRGDWTEKGQRTGKLRAAAEDKDKGGALVVLCVLAFSRVPSSKNVHGESKKSPGSVDARAWIAKWLKLVSPQRLVVVDLWAQVAGPSFFERFRACLQQSFVFFGHHDELRDWKEYPHILWMEDHFIGQCIVNIVAGEGRQRVFHLEPRSAVRSVLTKVGFKGSDLEKDAVASVREGLIGCNLPSCGLKAIEGDTLALNWVGQPLTYMSSFKL